MKAGQRHGLREGAATEGSRCPAAMAAGRVAQAPPGGPRATSQLMPWQTSSMQQGSHTIVGSKPASTTLTLTLRPRKTVQHKPARSTHRRRWLLSWKGLEEYREQIRALAHEVVASDAALRATAPSVEATGLICAAIRDPSTAPSPLVARAGKAQRDLSDLHSKLIWEHNLEYHFVRREWASIIDPSPAETQRCKETVKKTASIPRKKGKINEHNR